MTTDEIHVFDCIDGHTCGNPVRLVVSGHPPLKGDGIFEMRLDFINRFDWIRKALMFEPRGHDMMSGSFLFPPKNPENDSAVLFIETSGCLPMCGHGTIGTVTLALEEGILKPKIPGRLRLETPAGLVEVSYQRNGKKISSVKLINIPSFLFSEGLKVDCPQLGELNVDVAYGGNFYAIIDPQENFQGIEQHSALELIAWSRVIREEMNRQYSFVHPLNDQINGLSHVLWTGVVLDTKSHGRNAVFYGEKAIDRSPCGTGTSARMAQLYAKGKLALGDTYIHESIIGSKFIGKIEEALNVGQYSAIVPSIEGWAVKTGHNSIIVNPDDPFVFGFSVI